MSTGSGWPALEKEAASGSWRWSMERPGLPLSRPRQTWSSGASTETATDASWWWVVGRGFLVELVFFTFFCSSVFRELWCFHVRESGHDKTTEPLNEVNWKKRGQDSAERLSQKCNWETLCITVLWMKTSGGLCYPPNANPLLIVSLEISLSSTPCLWSLCLILYYIPQGRW